MGSGSAGEEDTAPDRETEQQYKHHHQFKLFILIFKLFMYVTKVLSHLSFLFSLEHDPFLMPYSSCTGMDSWSPFTIETI